MKQLFYLTTSLFLIIILAGGCSKSNDAQVDTEYPVIDLSAASAFPQQCGIVKRGESFTFRARLSDNFELGSVSVDVHHNFDHHTHSTEVSACQMEAIKTAVKPFLLIRTFPIAAGLKQYEIAEQITVPADVDPGDYHFLIRLTDKEGWQTVKGISIKIQ
ncbi:DUF4625 domain-containing protein [Mucilaginibacter pallidiroseus]|uniref:DUF4625 domain-containing protein n=1 Tax=Mucilaginibacter pallidiroseus TaxID=2599295 RepID=A0A563U5A6_9SPHI|nr:DUF4625 domain-containing protein [Mucilaginibacter pallidiroseus]TWR26518.1 DUF4625 domain-containing protein [Mucilaginibacter pallidiroseus]